MKMPQTCSQVVFALFLTISDGTYDIHSTGNVYDPQRFLAAVFTIINLLAEVAEDEVEDHPAMQELRDTLLSTVVGIDDIYDKYFPTEEEIKFTLVPPIKPEDTGEN
ncbi:MAG: hypothetical protein LBV23_00590 [Deltaproteobacteria bacterium]|jgi:hypothetical protein|nr:hypothetical protein [Deltaproteobacteria bacterium]